MDKIEKACGINSSQNFGLKTILINVMNGRKIACDRIENVCFDIGLISKGKAVL